MRLRTALPLVLTAVSLAAGGCGVLGLDSTTTGSGSSTATKAPGPSWLVQAAGSPTPSSGPSGPRGYRPALPPVSFPPALPPGCADAMPDNWTTDPVLIPLTITPGSGSLTVSWPRQYDSSYRITAVPQPLLSGNQPAYTWQNVAAGTGCTVTATVSGLRSGKPYVIWLDAPTSGYERDGTRHPYAGESGVVYPR